MKAREAYNKFAAKYDNWEWQSFWREAEMPIISTIFSGSKKRDILDVGTGTGRYLREFASIKHLSVGLDISEKMLDQARPRIFPFSSLVQADARSMPFPNRSFTRVIMARVMSHIEDIETLFSEIGRVVKYDGEIVISDVHPAHNYHQTHFSVDGTDISVDTYKHAVQRVAKIAHDFGDMKLINIYDIPAKSNTYNHLDDIIDKISVKVVKSAGIVYSFSKL